MRKARKHVKRCSILPIMEEMQISSKICSNFLKNNRVISANREMFIIIFD